MVGNFMRWLLPLSGLVVTGAAIYFVFGLHAPPGGPLRYVPLKIDKGMSARTVVERLESDHLLRHPVLFSLELRLTGKSNRLKAGEYLLNTHMSAHEIMNVLTEGRVETHAVTIVEGATLEWIAEVFESREFFPRATFLASAKDPVLARRYGVQDSFEGYLYPETYRFARGVSPVAVLEALHGEMMRRLGSDIDLKRASMGWSWHAVLTLASIIEAETDFVPEMPMISSVFHNRLKKRMRLQSDPTVIYGLTEFDGNLTRAHLKNPHPYNTYVHYGLPPGPIANPRIEAVRAAVFPIPSENLYFVSRNDGSHAFSKTYDEHRGFVREFQIERRAGNELPTLQKTR